jgi:hypothetical protein
MAARFALAFAAIGFAVGLAIGSIMFNCQARAGDDRFWKWEALGEHDRALKLEQELDRLKRERDQLMWGDRPC